MPIHSADHSPEQSDGPAAAPDPDRPQNRHLRPWRPGQSGNPKGRPRGRTLTSALRERLEATSWEGRELAAGQTVQDLVAEALIRGALAGDTTAAREILNRTEGKVPSHPAAREDDEALDPEVAAAMLRAGLEEHERMVADGRAPAGDRPDRFFDDAG